MEEAWHAAIHGVANSRTRLSDWTELNWTEGNISCKDGLKKGQKWYGPNRSRNIKKRWQEYIEDLYKKYLHDPDNYDGVITHLEPDILECEVKWALEKPLPTPAAAAAAAKLLQSCLTLCDPTDGSPPGSTVPGILQARTLDWVAIPMPILTYMHTSITCTAFDHVTSLWKYRV